VTEKQWRSNIKSATEAAGTYRPFFDAAINTLAAILARRDQAEAEFEESGGQMIVVRTNVAGKENIEQNPGIRLINDLNRDALAYWRDLGLTPAGLKRINENALKAEKKTSALERALMNLGG
jgi:hypothetical protein